MNHYVLLGNHLVKAFNLDNLLSALELTVMKYFLAHLSGCFTVSSFQKNGTLCFLDLQTIRIMKIKIC